jgi:hypothetical protein
MNMYNKLKMFYLRFEDWAVYRLHCLCGQPTPLKRLVAVLVMGGFLVTVNIYVVVSSIYNMGKRDAEKEFMKGQHIQRLELQKKDSINILNSKEYGYKQR